MKRTNVTQNPNIRKVPKRSRSAGFFLALVFIVFSAFVSILIMDLAKDDQNSGPGVSQPSTVLDANAFKYQQLTSSPKVTYKISGLSDQLLALGASNISGEIAIPSAIGSGAHGDAGFVVMVDIPKNQLKGAKISKIYIPNGIKYITEGSFYGVQNLKEIETAFIGARPGRYKTSATNALEGDKGNPIWGRTDYSGQVYEIVPGKEHSFFWIFGEVGGSYSIPTNYDSIIYSPQGVDANGVPIGPSAYHAEFAVPKSLETIIINHESYIGDWAFMGNKYAKEIRINVENSAPYYLEGFEFGRSVFYDNVSLESIVLPDYVDTYGDYLLRGCTNLTSIKTNEIFNLHHNGQALTSNSANMMSVDPSNPLYNTFFVPGDNTIQSGTFAGNASIVYIDVSHEIKIIEDFAFSGMTNLENIDLNPELDTIGERVFENCVSLKSVSIPTNVVSLGEGLFSGCYSLEWLSLPFVGKQKDKTDTATNPEQGLFGWVFGTSPYLNAYIAKQFHNDGPTYPSTPTYFAYIPTKLHTIIITNERILQTGAFSDLRIKTLVLPDSIETIESGALSNLGALNELSIPFLGYNREVTYSSDINKPHGVGGWVFGFTPYRLSNEALSFTQFYKYGLQAGNEYNYTFHMPKSLKILTITSQPKIYDNLLSNMSYLEKVTILGGEPEIGESFAGTTEIGVNALAGCKNLKSLYVPFIGNKSNTARNTGSTNASTRHLGYFFAKNTGFTSEYNIVQGPHTSDSFNIPINLKEIGISHEAYVTYENLANYKQIEVLYLDKGIEAFQSGCFNGLYNLKEITIPYTGGRKEYNGDASITDAPVFGHLFRGGSYVDSYRVDQKVAGGTLTAYIPNKLVQINLLGGEIIADYAFEGLKSVEHIDLPEELLALGVGTFKDCTNLSYVDIEHTQLTQIPDYCFYGCSFVYMDDVSSLNLPLTVKKIGKYAFAFNNLESVDLTRFEEIGDYAFSNNDDLKSVVIPAGYDGERLSTRVYKLGNFVFANCANLENVTLNNSYLPDGTFKNCPSIANMDFRNIKSIGAEAFMNNYSLTNITFTDGVSDDSTEYIGRSAFENCSNLKQFDLSLRTKTIESRAFAGCASLNFVRIPIGCNNLATDIFPGCNADLDFHLRVYLLEEQRPSTWKYWWNSGWPIIVEGLDMQDWLIYEFNFANMAFEVIGVKPGVSLFGTIVIPNTRYSVPVYKIREEVFEAYPGITKVIIGNNMKEMGDGINGKPVFCEDTIIDIFVNQPENSGLIYLQQPVIEHWLPNGRVFFNDVWEYDSVTDDYKLIENKYIFTFEDYGNGYTYDGYYKTPGLVSVTSKCIVTGNAIPYEFNKAVYTLYYANNLNAGNAAVRIYRSGRHIKDYGFVIRRAVVIVTGDYYQTVTGDYYVFRTSWPESDIIMPFGKDFDKFYVTGKYHFGWFYTSGHVFQVNRYLSYYPAKWGWHQHIGDSYNTDWNDLQVKDQNGSIVSYNFDILLNFTAHIEKRVVDVNWIGYVGFHEDAQGRVYHYEYSGDHEVGGYIMGFTPQGGVWGDYNQSRYSYAKIDPVNDFSGTSRPGDAIYTYKMTYYDMWDFNRYSTLGNNTIRFKIVPRKVTVKADITIERDPDPSVIWYMSENEVVANMINFNGDPDDRFIGRLILDYDGQTIGVYSSNHDVNIGGTVGFVKWDMTGYYPLFYRYLTNAYYPNNPTSSSGVDMSDCYELVLDVVVRVVLPKIKYNVYLGSTTTDQSIYTQINPTLVPGYKSFYQYTYYYDGLQRYLSVLPTDPSTNVTVKYAFDVNAFTTTPFYSDTGLWVVDTYSTYTFHVWIVEDSGRYEETEDTIRIVVDKRTVKARVSLDKIYDGQAISMQYLEDNFIDHCSTLSAFNNIGGATFYFIDDQGGMYNDLEVVDVGKYKLVLYYPATDYYHEFNGSFDFEIKHRLIEVEINGSHLYNPNTSIPIPIIFNAAIFNEINSQGVTMIVPGQKWVDGAVLKANNVVGIYKDGDYWFDPDWSVVDNVNGTIDYTKNYKFVVKGTYEIIPLEIQATIEGIDEVYTGLTYQVVVDVTDPQASAKIEYSYDGVNYFQQQNPITRVNVCDGLLYVKISAPNYRTLVKVVPLRIAPLSKDNIIVKFSQPDIFVYDGTEHGVSIECIRPAIGVIYYAEMNLPLQHPNWTTEIPTKIDVGVYTFYYKVVVAGMDVYSDSYTFEIIKDKFQDVYPALPNYVSYPQITVPYDGNGYQLNITVAGMVEGTDYTVQYFHAGWGVWASNPVIVDQVGTHEIRFRLIKPNFEVFEATGYIHILDPLDKQLEYDVQDKVVTFNNQYHGLDVVVTAPAAGERVYYSSASYVIPTSDKFIAQNGSEWSTKPIKFKDAGVYLIQVMIMADGYNTEIVARYLTILRAYDTLTIISELPYGEFAVGSNGREVIESLLDHDGDFSATFYYSDSYGNKLNLFPGVPNDLGYYYVEARFEQTNNLYEAYIEGGFRIVPRVLEIETPERVEFIDADTTHIIESYLIFNIPNGEVVKLALTTSGSPAVWGDAISVSIDASGNSTGGHGRNVIFGANPPEILPSNYVIGQPQVQWDIIRRVVPIIIDEFYNYNDTAGNPVVLTSADFLTGFNLNERILTHHTWDLTISTSSGALGIYKYPPTDQFTIVYSFHVYDSLSVDVTDLYYELDLDVVMQIGYDEIEVNNRDFYFEYQGPNTSDQTPELDIISTLYQYAWDIEWSKDGSPYQSNPFYFGDQLGSFHMKAKINGFGYCETEIEFMVYVEKATVRIDLFNPTKVYDGYNYVPQLTDPAIYDKFNQSLADSLSLTYYKYVGIGNEMPYHDDMRPVEIMHYSPLNTIYEAGKYFLLVHIPEHRYTKEANIIFEVMIETRIIDVDFYGYSVIHEYNKQVYVLPIFDDEKASPATPNIPINAGFYTAFPYGGLGSLLGYREGLAAGHLVPTYQGYGLISTKEPYVGNYGGPGLSDDFMIFDMEIYDQFNRYATHNYEVRVKDLLVTVVKGVPQYEYDLEQYFTYSAFPISPIITGDTTDLVTDINGRTTTESIFTFEYYPAVANPGYPITYTPLPGPALTEAVDAGTYIVVVNVVGGNNFLAQPSFEIIMHIERATVTLDWSFFPMEQFEFDNMRKVPEAYFTLSDVNYTLTMDAGHLEFVGPNSNGITVGFHTVRVRSTYNPNIIFLNNELTYEITSKIMVIHIDEVVPYEKDVPFKRVYTDEDYPITVNGHTFELTIETISDAIGIYSLPMHFNITFKVFDVEGNEITNIYGQYYRYEFSSLYVVIEVPEVQYETIDLTVPYTGNYYTPQIKVTRPLSGSDIRYKVSTDGSFPDGEYNLDSFRAKEVGTYTVYFQITASKYQTVTGYSVITIVRANPIISLKPLTKYYDKIEINAQTIMGLPGQENLAKLNYSASRYDGTLQFEFMDEFGNVLYTPIVNAGKYKVRIFTDDAVNYLDVDQTIDFEIKKAILKGTFTDTLVWNVVDQGSNYDATFVETNASVSTNRIDGMITNSQLTYTISTPASYTFATIPEMLREYRYNNSLGELDFVWSMLYIPTGGGPNEDITSNFEMDIEILVTIKYQDMNVTVTPFDLDYDGNFHNVNIVVQNPLQSVPELYYIEFSDDGVVWMDEATFVGKKLPNTYNIHYRVVPILANGAAFEVYQGSITNYIYGKDASVSSSFVTKVYDGIPVDFITDQYLSMWDGQGNPVLYAFQDVDLKYFHSNGQAVIGLPVDAGNYRVDVNFKYDVYKPISVSFDFSITKRDLYVETVNIISKTYNATPWINSDWSDTSLYTVTGLPLGHLLTLTLKTLAPDSKLYQGNTGLTYNVGSGYAVTYGDKNVTNNFVFDYSGVRVRIEKIDLDYALIDAYSTYTGFAVKNTLSFSLPSNYEKPTVYYSFNDPNDPLLEEEWNLAGNSAGYWNMPGKVNVGRYTVYYKIYGVNYNEVIDSALIVIGLQQTYVYNLDPALGLDMELSKIYDGDPALPKPVTNRDQSHILSTPHYTYYHNGQELNYVPINVGVYECRIRYYANENFAEFEEQVTFVISARPLSIQWDEDEYVYDGLEHAPKVVLNDPVAIKDKLEFTYTYYDSNNNLIPKPKDVGNYFVECQITGNLAGNYYIDPFTSVLRQPFKIIKKVVYVNKVITIPVTTPTLGNPITINLDETNFIGVVLADRGGVGFPRGQIQTQSDDVGIYAIGQNAMLKYEFSSTLSVGYPASYTSSTLELQNYSIDVSGVTIIIFDDNFNYIAIDQVVPWDGNNHYPYIDVIGKPGIEVYVTVTDITDPLNTFQVGSRERYPYETPSLFPIPLNAVGIYSVYVEFIDPFDASNNDQRIAYLTILAEVPTFTIDFKDRTYDNTPTNETNINHAEIYYNGTINSYPNGTQFQYERYDDALGLFLPISGKPIDAGVYRVVATAPADSGYSGAVATDTFTIDKAVLIISRRDASSLPITHEYNAAVWVGVAQEDANTPPLVPNTSQLKVTGLMPGHVFDGLVETYGSDVLTSGQMYTTGFVLRNDYTIRDGSSSSKKHNYEITYNLAVEIVKRQLVEGVDFVIINYHDYYQAGVFGEVTISFTNPSMAALGNMKQTLDGNSVWANKIYPIIQPVQLSQPCPPTTVYISVEFQNYSDLQVTGTITIDALNPIISFDAFNMEYNGSPYTGPTIYAPIYTSPVVLPVITYQTIGGTSIPTPVNVGKYKVTVSFPANSPYAAGSLTKEFEITPKKTGLTITWDTTPLVYNGLVQCPTATVTGILPSDVVNLVYTMVSTGPTAGINANVPYTIKVSTTNPNYDFSLATPSGDTHTYLIEPKPVTIPTAPNPTLTYTGLNQEAFPVTSEYQTAPMPLENWKCFVDSYSIAVELTDPVNTYWDGTPYDTGTQYVLFDIVPVVLSLFDGTLVIEPDPIPDQDYTGSPIIPTVSVYWDPDGSGPITRRVLDPSTMYTVTVSSGYANIDIQGAIDVVSVPNGNYSFSETLYFNIKAPTLLEIDSSNTSLQIWEITDDIGVNYSYTEIRATRAVYDSSKIQAITMVRPDTSLTTMLAQFTNNPSNIEFYDADNNLMTDYDYLVTTGTRIVLKDAGGTVIDQLFFIIAGDVLRLGAYNSNQGDQIRGFVTGDPTINFDIYQKVAADALFIGIDSYGFGASNDNCARIVDEHFAGNADIFAGR